MKIAVLFAAGSPVLIPFLVQPSSFQWYSSGKLLACQPHRSFREKSKFHLDRFWTPLNIVLSQASREPVFITGWVQLQKDQGLRLFWVMSIKTACLKPRRLLVPNHFPGSQNEIFCQVARLPGMRPHAHDGPALSLFEISSVGWHSSLLPSLPDNTVCGTQYLTLIFGSGLVCESHVRAEL